MKLTPKQKEVLSLLIDGLSNQEIADKMFITESTVKLHVRDILRKYNLRDRLQLIVKYYKNELSQTLAA